MAFQDLLQGAKRFFGPDNTFFHGARTQQENDVPQEEPAPQMEAPMSQQPEQNYQQPAYQQAPYQQAAYQQPQQQYQPQPAYQQPQQYQPQVQQSTQNPFQQGYRPPQPQQSVNEPYVAPRNRRSAQHQQPPQPQPQPDPNVVPFPGAAPQPQQPAQPQKATSACVINVRSIADCRNAIGILRSNDCVLAVMDSIADQAEIRRYVDTLNGACFSLGCTMTRLSARVGVYLLAPAGMNVYTDQATTQMNSQSRAPQRQAQPQQQRPMQAAPQQQAFRPPYQQAPQQGAYQQPSPYGQMQQQAYQQPQQAAPVFTTQAPAQGYSPDTPDAEYNAI